MSVSTLYPAPLSAWARAERADALLILVRAKLLILGSADDAMAVLGISRGDMAAARDRIPGRMTSRPATRPERYADIQPRPPGRSSNAAGHQTTAPVPTPAKPQFRSEHGKPPTTARPVSDEGELRCSRCGQWKPAAEFRLRSDRIGSGTRRSACDLCHARANRSRYVSLKVKAELNALGVTLSLEDGDAIAGLVCLRCGKALGPGDDIETTGAAAHAGRCPT